MKTIKQRLMIKQRLIQKLNGVAAIEYGLIAALVSVAIILSLTNMGTQLGLLFQDVADKIAAVLA